MSVHNTRVSTQRGQPSKPDSHRAIREERGSVYGPHEPNHENIGLSWTAAIQSHYDIRLPYPIPAYLSETMMAAFKCVRMARPVFHTDSHPDLLNYADFAHESHAHWVRPSPNGEPARLSTRLFSPWPR